MSIKYTPENIYKCSICPTPCIVKYINEAQVFIIKDCQAGASNGQTCGIFSKTPLIKLTPEELLEI